MTLLRPTALVALAVTAALLPPNSPAFAQTCEAPPGTSAVEQYCEAIPEGSGSESGSDFQRSSRASESQGTSPGNANEAQGELADAGADGSAVIALAENTGPKGSDDTQAGANEQPESDAADGRQQRNVENAPGGPLKAISASVENGSTLGAPFGWALLASLVAVAGLAWLRFRRAG